MLPALVPLGLFACSGADDGWYHRPRFGDEPTDTFPQFYGRPPKNIVMISLDTFRKDHLDRYGADGVTPFLTAVANGGVVLDDHVQCSNWTFASTSCTLAGRANEEAGMIPSLSDTAAAWLVGTPFLARYLGEAGFFSVLVSTNGWLAPKWRNTEGYDEAVVADSGLGWDAYVDGRDRLLTARRDGRADGPWMLHVHMVEPHAPYDPPKEYLGGLDALPPAPWDLTIRDDHYAVRDDWPLLSPEDQELLEAHLRVRYAGELSYLDDELYRIFADLQLNALLDDALVVFWTDHGEQFWEHGYQTHAYGLNAEENDALLFFWAPNIVPAAFSGPTTSIDLVPTLLSVLDVPMPDAVTGIPLGEAPADRPRFAESVSRLGASQSVIQDGWKLTFSYTGGVQLFDRNTDPEEAVDLYDPSAPSPEARSLWSALEPQIELMSPLVPEHPVNWPDELR
jgi:arylsulfatase A-like enzyme